MIAAEAARDLIVAFPAAGSGGSTLEQLEDLAVRRGLAYVALSNPGSIDALELGEWHAQSVNGLLQAADRASATRVIMVGHCMGGLSAIRFGDGLSSRLALPVSLLVVNTPCPDASGRIPTMSDFSDAEIAEVLAHDGFPQDLLDDEDILAEIADGLRADATVADRLAAWVARADDLETLHVLSTRGDHFIPPEKCVGWGNRVSGEFHLMITPGGHQIDEASVGVLERALDAVRACPQTEFA